MADQRTRVNVLRGVITVLVIMIALLLWYYYQLSRPKVADSGKPEVEGLQHIFTIHGPAIGDSFLGPTDVAVDGRGDIYVADVGKKRVLKFDFEGDYLDSIAPPTGAYESPIGVDVADNGEIYVTDRDLHQLMVFDEDGKKVRSWMVMYPHFPQVEGNKVFLTTYGPFYAYNTRGKELLTVGKRGRGPGQFSLAYGVVSDGNGNIYVADTMNNRLVSMDGSGEERWVLGQPSKGMTDTSLRLEVPLGLAMDDRELIYLVDSFGNSIEVFNKNGKSLGKFGGEEGTEDGKFSYPAGIEYAGGRRFVIADKGNDRVQVVELEIPEGALEELRKEGKAPGLWDAILAFLRRIWMAIVGLIR